MTFGDLGLLGALNIIYKNLGVLGVLGILGGYKSRCPRNDRVDFRT
jgi:hypothetical protein